jgi:hypothetical protein
MRAVALALAVTGATFVSPAVAQQYPNQDIHFVNGFPPDSGADVITRFFAEKLRPVRLGERVRAGIAGRLHPRALVPYRDTQPALIRWPEKSNLHETRTRALYEPCRTTRQSHKLARFTW